MHRLLHDYFWIYILVIAVLCGAMFYFTPKPAMKFLNKSGGKNRPAGKNEPGKTADNNKKRYRTF